MEEIVMNKETKTKRAYHRRTPEEIAQEKLLKEQRKAEREAKRTAKEEKEEEKKMAKKNDDAEAETTEKSEKKAAKSKSNGQKTIMPKMKGAWSDPLDSLVMERHYFELELLEDCLGTGPSDKDLLSTFIASRAPDAASREEEIAALGEDTLVQKGTTMFYKGIFRDNGKKFIDVLDRREGFNFSPEDHDFQKMPFFWNYQIRGMFKDSCGLLSRASYGESAGLKAYKKVIDGGVFVFPRRLAIKTTPYYITDEGDFIPCNPTSLQVLQRPLRIQDKNGERTAIAASEVVPAGSRIKFGIAVTDPKFMAGVYEWLNYGSEHGLGAWRNSGKGIFRWRELNDDWTPMTDEE